ncbi:DUF5134 domain-containing protein [Streptomyces sp. NPDC088358]|uniref:DUF5134 domain-containing protein n=1 Tax=Streptomyces sp. NPDC088358 TaxID=3365857 RepID=UPI0037F9949B
MSASDVIYCMLTPLFVAAAVHGLRHEVLSRRSGWRSRVDRLLHTAMALVMAVMPWLDLNRVLPGGAQTAFFAAAALWYPLTAVSGLQESVPAAAARRLPYAIGMAAMGWMTRPGAAEPHEALGGGPVTAHHSGHPVGQMEAADTLTAVLALYLLAHALKLLTRDMPTLRTARSSDISTDRELYGRFWEGTTALGTAVMLLLMVH